MSILKSIFGKRPHNPPATPPERKLEDYRLPGIWLRRTPGLSTLSKLGGLPSLPNHLAWPRHTVTAAPLHFLAQIDLASLPPTPLEGRSDGPKLPRSGIVFFFADIDEEMLWDDDDNAAVRVLAANAPGAERDAPAELPEIGHEAGKLSGGYAKGKCIFPEVTVQPFVIDTYAGAQLYFQGDGSKNADLATIASIERATGNAVPVFTNRSQMRSEHFPPAAVIEINSTPPRREIEMARHQMLGAGTDVQGTASAEREAGNILLLQIDSDYGVSEDFMFCDMGMAQFWIRPDDLAAGRFEKSWGTTEGG